MLTVGSFAFTAPALLLALIALPALWLILRAIPPAPVRRRFPGVALLLGLTDDETQADRTPWWLLLLRMLAVAAVILGFAGPVLNPTRTDTGSGPLLVVMDGTWADARDWQARLTRVEGLLTEAVREGRAAAVVTLTDPPAGELPLMAADAWIRRLPSLAPKPWQPDPNAVASWIAALPETRFESFWLSDGLDRPDRLAVLEALEARGPVRVQESPRPALGLHPAVYGDGLIRLRMSRAGADGAPDVTVIARGLDPSGTERDLARVDGTFEQGETEMEIELSLPAELRNRVTRFEVAGLRSAGAVSLTDDALRRREVALLAGRGDEEGFDLLSPLHYLREALAASADLIEAPLADVLPANPDVIILADVARLSPSEAAQVATWVEAGGLLVRFAGPRLAAADVGVDEDDPLMPVRLRAGGRSVGGAMSWGAPKTLRAFDEGSPFYGLAVPGEVTVTAQVLAQPDPELAERTIAALSDGTPLVTTTELGEGRVVLFHVTANAEWSSLPLSGLFVQMLERLAVSTRPATPDAEELAGTTWVPDTLLDAYGRTAEAGTMAGLDGAVLAEMLPGPETPPGLYTDGERRIALNAVGAETELARAAWPPRIHVEGLSVARETLLKGWFLAVALTLLLADVLAALWLSGKLPRLRRAAAPVAMMLAAVLATGDAQAQEIDDDLERALQATSEVVLAYVITGNDRLDRTTEAGLTGLSDVLFARTSIEPADPIGVDLETDELSFFPLVYWAITPEQPLPSAEAYARLNRYLRTGGMILFDTRDANVAGYGSGTPEAQRLQRIASGLDIPPLEPIPEDHVLTRAFYLLQDFPGRHRGDTIWVEAAPPDAEAVEGVPFRNLNDGVTPVVIGGNDWAAAWAVDENYRPMYRVGSGYAGERQREIAYRFGVNLVMHVLTGNYKSDQVHVPALLDRLGN